MGWQSYYVIIDSDAERDRVLEAIRAHNTETNFDLVGEEVVMPEVRELRRRTKQGRQVILFGNGGGRFSTFKYFDNLGILLMPFDCKFESRLKDQPRTEIQI